MDVARLFRDYGVPVAQPGDGNYRDGWTNVRCPFCADHSKHLGIADSGATNCWRCGAHPLRQALGKILGIDERKLGPILTKYEVPIAAPTPTEVKRKPRTKAHKLPTGTMPLNSRHKRYLQKRKFDPDQLAEVWGVQGTGPIAKLDHIDYKHRIVAPIFWEGEQVSFQARDVTGKHPIKYLACPKDRELINHQDILYGKQEEWQRVGICVEGITDAWRFGPVAFATFGIDFTRRQLRHIAKNFDRVLIAFDPEPQAQLQAKKLMAELRERYVEGVLLDLPSDPGDLTPKQARRLIRKIF